MGSESLPSQNSKENPQGELAFPAWKGEDWKTLPPGYNYNEDGEIVDAKGNIYSSEGDLKSTAASSDLEKEIQRLEKVRPELAGNRGALTELARINLSAKKSGTSYKTKPYPPLDR